MTDYTVEETPGGLFVWETCSACGYRQMRSKKDPQPRRHAHVYTTRDATGYPPTPCPNETRN